ncbi:MAG: thioredoxin family protein [Anaeroplasma bactoclasticum]|nr:thioredoxin family protein [Anaeroplasma bactoclasticum]
MYIQEIENGKIDISQSNEQLIVLHFYTKWCPTCKRVGVVLEEIEELHPEILVIEIDADAYQDLSNLYKVRTAPTLLFFKKGEIKYIHNGYLSVEEFEEIILNYSNES